MSAKAKGKETFWEYVTRISKEVEKWPKWKWSGRDISAPEDIARRVPAVQRQGRTK